MWALLPPHEPRADDPYFKRWIARHGIAAWENLSRLPRTVPMQAHEILRDFVGLACISQQEENINLGRWGLLQLPHDWVVAQLPAALEEVLAEGDRWEYRRALELAYFIDRDLLHDLLHRAAESADPQIRALAAAWP